MPHPTPAQQLAQRIATAALRAAAARAVPLDDLAFDTLQAIETLGAEDLTDCAFERLQNLAARSEDPLWDCLANCHQVATGKNSQRFTDYLLRHARLHLADIEGFVPATATA